MKLKRHFPNQTINQTKMCDAEYQEGECERCQETKQVMDNYIIGEIICDRCFDDNFGKCKNCGDPCLLCELIENDYNCENCEACACCGESFAKDANSGIYCEDCEEELTCKECGVCDEDVMGGKCGDCFKKQLDENEKKILKIAKQDKQLRARVVRKLIKQMKETLKIVPEKKKPRLKIVCDHKWHCGCYKEICEECVENGDKRFDLCNDEDCCMYYEHRNDKCDCNGRDCGFCISRRHGL